MTEFFKTLLFLNIQGSIIILVLCLLKPIIRKAFSGFWQRNLWVIAALLMIFPMWKLVPVTIVQPIVIPMGNMFEEYVEIENPIDASEEFGIYTQNEIILPTIKNNFSLSNMTFYVYVTGVAVFFSISFGSYFFYLKKMKTNSNQTEESDAYTKAKENFKIKRKIRVRKTNVSESPLLTGCIFPIIYVPESLMDEKTEELVYLHELMHFKHKDLIVKWFVCLINAINWFNPFMYILTKNLNEACEIYCDESVTKNMDIDGKKMYMHTIVNLIARK